MKLNAKMLISAMALGLFTTSALAKSSLPKEIYQPKEAEVIKADRQGNGEFEAEFRLNTQKTSVKKLANQVIEHAKKQGFRVEETEIKSDDADLKFKRGKQELDVSIEQKDHHRIEYKADLDLDKN